MYKMTIKAGEKVEELEFDSPKLAKLYKDYHIAFGHWKGKSQWKKANKVTPEEMKFVVDEMTEINLSGDIERTYLLLDGIQIIEERVVNNTKDCWDLFREHRDNLLFKSDFSQIPDNSLSTDLRLKWRKYRQYLRDCPKLYNDTNIAGKSPTTFEEWLNGKF